MGSFNCSNGWTGGPGRYAIRVGDEMYPKALGAAACHPEVLYVSGSPDALMLPMVAVVGPRKATPYGLACARRFAAIAAEAGFCVVTGGGRGVGAEAHRSALEAGGVTVAILGGGLSRPYPLDHEPLFRRIADAGGAVVSEQPWDAPPLPWMFRARNRVIAAIALATLVCEAGLPSGSFSLCDEALALGKPVLAVPGPITSPASAGTNRLLLEGAKPVVDDSTFLDALEAARA